MSRALRTPQRYQLSKHALAIVESGHPWIFRDQLSSAATALADGQWVALYDGSNKVVAHGVYQTTGAVGIRILARGAERPSAATLGPVIDAAIAKREGLWKETDAVRVLHGESDGVPGVVVDVFRGAGVAVVQAYAPGLFALARWAARRVAERLGLTTIVEKPPKRGRGSSEAPRALRGAVPELVRFTEGGRAMVASPAAGQKTGTFLDLRGLRRDLAARPLTGARVLDLFSYTGGLGLAAATAGAKEVWHVDASEAALLLGEAHHAGGGAAHTWIEADVFEWLPELDPAARFEVVIVDPPSMTSSMDQVPRVLAAYKKLYGAARRHVADGGLLIACCCTSRIARHQFRKTVGDALGGGKGFDLELELPAEADHPVGFPQADYLKVLVFRSRGGERVPELPDITIYVERLAAYTQGKVLERVRLGSPFVLRSVDPPIAAVNGLVVEKVGRLGKRLVLSFPGELHVVIHLMIAGRLRWKKPGAPIAKKVGLAAFDFAAGSILFTEASPKKRASITVVRGQAALDDIDRGGIDLLTSTTAQVSAALRAENHTIKRALTDPTVIDGVGNAYSDEILHRAKLSPFRQTRQLTDDELARLHAASKEVLTEWIERLRAEVGDGFPDVVTAFHAEMAVHGKYGQPCPVCGHKVQRIRYADNEANYCAVCQTAGKLLADRGLSRLLKENWPKTLEELEDRKRQR